MSPARCQCPSPCRSAMVHQSVAGCNRAWNGCRRMPEDGLTLRGVCVLDLSEDIARPFGETLAGLGAEVIKLNDPARGMCRDGRVLALVRPST